MFVKRSTHAESQTLSIGCGNYSVNFHLRLLPLVLSKYMLDYNFIAQMQSCYAMLCNRKNRLFIINLANTTKFSGDISDCSLECIFTALEVLKIFELSDVVKFNQNILLYTTRYTLLYSELRMITILVRFSFIINTLFYK